MTRKNTSNFISHIMAVALGMALTSSTIGQESVPNDLTSTVYSLNYKISPGDHIRISIEGEPDVSNTQEVDVNGQVRLIYVDKKVNITGLTRLGAEQRIVDAYIDSLIFKQPKVTVAITNTAPKEVFLSGLFNKQGPYAFPPETESLEISELITRAGGMSPIARTTSVRLTRGASGERIENINVKRILDGTSKEAPIYIYPGDMLYVGERMF